MDKKKKLMIEELELCEEYIHLLKEAIELDYMECYVDSISTILFHIGCVSYGLKLSRSDIDKAFLKIEETI